MIEEAKLLAETSLATSKSKSVSSNSSTALDVSGLLAPVKDSLLTRSLTMVKKGNYTTRTISELLLFRVDRYD